MKRNVGPTDAIVRIIIGSVIAAIGLTFRTWWGVLAIIPFITAFTGMCPLYNLLGINTCKKQSENS